MLEYLFIEINRVHLPLIAHLKPNYKNSGLRFSLNFHDLWFSKFPTMLGEYITFIVSAILPFQISNKALFRTFCCFSKEK